LIQIYTGNGKGKTTAALGLALRAAGAGLEVFIGQFVKGRYYSELAALKKFKNIKVEQFGRGCFVKRAPKKKDIELAKKGLQKIRKIINEHRYDLVILDEVNIALHFNLLDLGEVIEIIKSAPKKMEIILTGRAAHPQIIKMADLVSEVKEVKHYFKKGIAAS